MLTSVPRRPAAAFVLVAIALLSVPAALAGVEIEDLLWDLQIVPMDGRDAPAFTLENLARSKVALADFRGKPVLLYFWATW